MIISFGWFSVFLGLPVLLYMTVITVLFFLSFYNWTPRPLSAEADRADVDAKGLVVRADVVGRDIDDR